MPKFIVPGSALAKALAQVTPAVPGNPLVAALDNVLLVCQGSVVGEAAALRLVCSSLETTLESKLTIECQENFAALIPAKKLLETLRLLPDQPLTLTANEADHSLTIKAERSKYVLTGDATTDFPKHPALQVRHQRVSLPGNVLRTGLVAALSAARRDNLGVSIENVLVEVQLPAYGGYNVNIVGLDSFGVAVATWYCEETPDPAEAFSVMLSRSGAEHLVRLLGEKDEAPITLLADATTARLADGRWTSRRGEGTYPDYQRALPTSSPNTLVVDAAELLAAVKRLDKYAPGRDRTITMHLCPGASVALSTEDTGLSQSGDETVAGEYDGEEMSINFNSAQLANLLGLFKDSISIGLGDASRPALFTADTDPHDYAPLTYLLMPLRILIPA